MVHALSLDWRKSNGKESIMPKGILGVPRPLGFTPVKALREDRRRTCETKEGDLVTSFTFNLDVPRRADTLDIDVGDVAGPGGDTTQEFTVPTRVSFIGMARRKTREFELGSGESNSVTVDRPLLARKATFRVIPDNRGFESVTLCVE